MLPPSLPCRLTEVADALLRKFGINLLLLSLPYPPPYPFGLFSPSLLTNLEAVADALTSMVNILLPLFSFIIRYHATTLHDHGGGCCCALPGRCPGAAQHVVVTLRLKLQPRIDRVGKILWLSLSHQTCRDTRLPSRDSRNMLIAMQAFIAYSLHSMKQIDGFMIIVETFFFVTSVLVMHWVACWLYI
jgi:hypothetical protein